MRSWLAVNAALIATNAVAALLVWFLGKALLGFPALESNPFAWMAVTLLAIGVAIAGLIWSIRLIGRLQRRPGRDRA